MTEGERAAWLADRLASARSDAERIARELVERGLVTREEAAALAEAVDVAVERGRELVAQALVEPRRLLASLRTEPPASATGDDRARELRGRLDAVEDRLALLEDRALHGRVRHGGEGD
jgi:DNA-binding MarR family transcriptional regulator